MIWRSNNALGSLHAYDLITRPLLQAEKIEHLDIFYILEAFKGDLQTGCCSDVKSGNGLHVGVIGKYSKNKNSPGSRVTVSSLITQALLDKMFPRLHIRTTKVKY